MQNAGVPDWFWGVVVFVFGACWGSFLNVCIWRMPRDQSLVTPGSRCGSCGTPIPWYHNIPLVSYFLLGGKCHQCGAAFAFRYWLVEFLNAVMWLLVWRQFVHERGWIVVVAYCILISMLIVGTFIDFEFYIIPDRITLGSVLLGFLFSVVFPVLHQAESHWDSARISFFGILAGGGSLWLIVEAGKLAFGRLKIPLAPGSPVVIEDGKIRFEEDEVPWDDLFFRASDRIRFRAATLKFQDKSFENAEVSVSEDKIEVNGTSHELAAVGRVEATTDLLILPREAMGFGDVKLMAGIGAFLGWRSIFFILMASAMVGSMVGLALVVLRKREMQGKIPYGPYIALAAVLWIFVGPFVVGWYWGLSEPDYGVLGQ